MFLLPRHNGNEVPLPSVMVWRKREEGRGLGREGSYSTVGKAAVRPLVVCVNINQTYSSIETASELQTTL